MLQRITVLVGAALVAGCSVFGIRSGTEQPAYEVVDRMGEDIEIRRYGERLAAEVTVEGEDEMEARDAAFRILAGYIFGDNQAAEEIAMTAPVSVERRSEEIAMTAPVETSARGDGRYGMRFFLPASYSAETVPQPDDPRVAIVTVPEEIIAAIRFTGSRDTDDVAEREARLLAVLDGSRWQPMATPVSYFYDPPWTIAFLRRAAGKLIGSR